MATDLDGIHYRVVERFAPETFAKLQRFHEAADRNIVASDTLLEKLELLIEIDDKLNGSDDGKDRG